MAVNPRSLTVEATGDHQGPGPIKHPRGPPCYGKNVTGLDTQSSVGLSLTTWNKLGDLPHASETTEYYCVGDTDKNSLEARQLPRHVEIRSIAAREAQNNLLYNPPNALRHRFEFSSSLEKVKNACGKA